MLSDVSDVADVVRERLPQGQLPKQSFSVYDGPAKSSKPAEEVKAKFMEELRLGARVRFWCAEFDYRRLGTRHFVLREFHPLPVVEFVV